MKVTRERKILNDVFKQFQRLPEWPPQKIGETNDLAQKTADAKVPALQPENVRSKDALQNPKVFVHPANHRRAKFLKGRPHQSHAEDDFPIESGGRKAPDLNG